MAFAIFDGWRPLTDGRKEKKTHNMTNSELVNFLIKSMP